jgi:hypothetical protein
LAKSTTSSRVRYGGCGARSHRCPDFRRDTTGLNLIAQQSYHFRRRPYPDQTGIDCSLGEIRVFRQKTVPGMDGISIGSHRQSDDVAYMQITVLRCAAFQGISLVGKLHESASTSSSAYTAMEVRPVSAQARMILTAISPRLAMSTLFTARFIALFIA